jgi:group I intron endonuclease
MATGVYIIKNRLNGKVYVGSARDISRRWRVHRRSLRSNSHHSDKLQRAWNKYGATQFSFEVLEVVSDVSQLFTVEQRWMDSFCAISRGYNIFPVAGSPLGYTHTEQAKAKMSAAGKGRVFTVEHRVNISAAITGRKVSPKMLAVLNSARPKGHSEATRKKMSVSSMGNTNRVGTRMSESAKQKISLSLKGRPKSAEARKNIADAIRRRFAERVTV